MKEETIASHNTSLNNELPYSKETHEVGIREEMSENRTIEQLKSERRVYEKQYHGIIDENDKLKERVSDLESQLVNANNEIKYLKESGESITESYQNIGAELVKAKELLNDFLDEFDERIIGNWKLREKVKSFLSDKSAFSA